ncbi:MAG: ATP synthase subunit a [Actinobacteria bacterium ADurb.Bin444]|nr:MAG: ATP synthase subunit a [Actinobacteria bacterium ADurb.Bin444]
MHGEEIHITPDQAVFFQAGFFKLNATIVMTWVVMLVLVIGSILITRRLTSSTKIPRWQNLVETIMSALRSQIRDISEQNPDPYVPFVGTLFIFILTCNILAPIPIYEPPTGSLSLTAALSLTVFFAVPVFGVRARGFVGYLGNYTKPFFFMAPLHAISELSRTVSLAMRLFGNVMSEGLIVALLLSIVPFVLPVVMEALGLLMGTIQAYIFAILTTVYIAAGTSGGH